MLRASILNGSVLNCLLWSSLMLKFFMLPGLCVQNKSMTAVHRALELAEEVTTRSRLCLNKPSSRFMLLTCLFCLYSYLCLRVSLTCMFWLYVYMRPLKHRSSLPQEASENNINLMSNDQEISKDTLLKSYIYISRNRNFRNMLCIIFSPQLILY